jgi:hypothetical protein
MMFLGWGLLSGLGFTGAAGGGWLWPRGGVPLVCALYTREGSDH